MLQIQLVRTSTIPHVLFRVLKFIGVLFKDPELSFALLVFETPSFPFVIVGALNFLLVPFRALNCLFSIANEAEIVKVTGQSVGELKQYMRNLMFLAR